MNDLQKNQAIYQAMCKIAEKYFNRVIESDESFRKFMAEKVNISAKELAKYPQWIIAFRELSNDCEDETITVDSFSCKFSAKALFDKELLETFRALAKVKTPYLFTYEEKIPNKFIGSTEITFSNPANAKSLAEHVSKEDMYPPLCNVLVELNAETGDINFVACDRCTLGVISNNADSIHQQPTDGSKVFQALFSASDWKQICDYARKSKTSVKFDVYKFADGELQDTIVAHLADKKIKSIQVGKSYPNWRKVLQHNADKHFAIHPDDVKAAQKFIQSIKLRRKYEKERNQIFVSFYRGSDIAYFDYFDLDFNIQKTATFRLSEPSRHTIGTCFKVHQLQKMRFTGFHIESSERSLVLDTEETDYMLVMPIPELEEYVFHVEEREVLTQLSTVA